MLSLIAKKLPAVTDIEPLSRFSNFICWIVIKKWLFVVGVGGGREWEGELGVGGVLFFRINPLRPLGSSP